MATNFRVKFNKIGLLTYIRRPGIRKRCRISQFRGSMALLWLHRI